MPGPALAIAGIGAAASIGGAALGASAQKKAAKTAANAEIQAAQLQVDEARAAREQMRELLQPYVSAGTPALQQMLTLAGLGQDTTDWEAYARSNPALMKAYNAQSGGVTEQSIRAKLAQQGGLVGFLAGRGGLSDEFINAQGQKMPAPLSLSEFAQQWHNQKGGNISPFTQTAEQQQQAAIDTIANNPLFLSQVQQGEDAILQNASATGGLRGGNTQGALAQFRPAMLNQEIQQQYARLAGLAGMGQNAAAGTGAAGLNAAGLTGQAFGNMGSAGAGAALAAGQANANLYSGIGSSLGNILGSINWGGSLSPSGIAAANQTVGQTIAENPGIF